MGVIGVSRDDTEQCDRCEDAPATGHFKLGANTEDPMYSVFQLCDRCTESLGDWFVHVETDRPPELPVGLSVFTPQGTDTPVLRTPDGNYRMDPERARDLGRLLLARTEPETERRGSQ